MTEPLVLLPDVTKLVTDFLRAVPELTALVAQRVYSILPAERTYPLVVATQVADVPGQGGWHDGLWWSTAADLRISSYDTTANGARHVLEVVRSALAQRAVGAHALGVVTGVSFVNFAYLPDDGVQTSTGRPIPRWTTLATVGVHPNP